MPLGPPIPPPSPGPLPPLPLPPSALIPFFPDLPWGFPFNRMPNMATIVQTPQSGRETRWGQQIYPQWEFELPFEELRDQTLNQTIYQPFVGFTQFQRLLGLFLLGMGRWGLFYFDDPADNSRAGQRIGTGDGSTKDFLIIRTWGIGAYQLTEPVGGINTGTAKVYLNGVLQVSGYSLTGADDAPKTLMFVSAPANGVVITMDFHFYYLCRFSDDQHNYEEFYKNRWTTNIKFRSVVAYCAVALSPYTPPGPPPPPPNPCPCPGALSTSSGGTWDPATGYPGMQDAFTSGNTVLNPHKTTGPAGYPSAVWWGTTSHATGFYYAEFHYPPGETIGGFILFGLTKSTTFPPTGSSAGEIGVEGTSASLGIGPPFLSVPAVYIGASVIPGSTDITALPVTDSGSWYGAVFDLSRKLIWVTRDGVHWNDGVTADPTCGVGGWDISALSAGSYFLAASEVLGDGAPRPGITLITNSNSGAARGTLPTCVAWW